MPTRKIADPPPRPCSHPEHDPPGMMVFAPGTYEHECPRCHHIIVFTVRERWLSSGKCSWLPVGTLPKSSCFG